MAKAIYVGTKREASTDENTLLMLHLNNSLKDESQLNTVTSTGATFTTDSKFGTHSASGFAASKGLKVANNNAFNFGSGNFTVEFWVKFTNVSTGYQTLIDRRGTTDGTGWLILVEQGNYLAFLASNGSSWNVNLNFGAIADYLNKWVHIAVVRNGNTITAYVNGVAKASTTTSISINSVSTDMSIGVGSSLITSGLTANHYLKGYIDEIRISNIARWTGNFTVPSSAYVVTTPEADDVAHKVKKIYIGVNGIAKKVKKGYIGVNGIARLFYMGGLPLSSLPEGALVRINESNSPTLFHLTKHDYESGLNGTGRTLLVKKGYYNTPVVFGSNTYAGGTLDNWFINTYKPMLDSKLQELIGETKIPVYQTSGSTAVTSISRAVFALSMVEYGGAGGYYPDGTALSIAPTLKSGLTVDLWTRSTYSSETGKAIFLYYTGGSYHYTIGDTWARFYPQPAFTLPSTMFVNPEPNADGSYTLLV